METILKTAIKSDVSVLQDVNDQGKESVGKVQVGNKKVNEIKVECGSEFSNVT